MTYPFYTSIAPYYQHIFPFNPEQIGFLKHVLPFNGARVLDIGCATGELAFALTHFGFPLWAIDSDGQMIKIAIKNRPEEMMFPVFEQLDMRTIDQRFPESYFDTVICFGNTLVHLQNDDEILTFIRSVFKVLSEEGKFAIQILNYQYIVGQAINELPLIDNEYVRFERRYEFGEPGSILFHSQLTVKSTGQKINHSIPLHAVEKDHLYVFLDKAGFTSIEFFGGFNFEPVSGSSLSLVVTCRKK